MLRRNATITLLLIGAAQAQNLPAPITAPGGSGTTPDLTAIIDKGMNGVNNTFSTIDSTIALLQNAIKILGFVPGIGQLAQLLTPVINTYMDIKTTVQPIMDTVARGRQFLLDATNAKETLSRIFSSGNLNDSLSNINTLVSQFGGLAQVTGKNRQLDPRNVRSGMTNLLTAADQQIQAANHEAELARRNGDLNDYRFQLRRVEELNRVRTQLRQAGEMAAAQQDNANITASTNGIAKAMASRTETQANQLRAVQSAEGGLKILGTVALDQLNTTAAGFEALSQQLALISQQQTITNEQTNQLLGHFEQQAREQNAIVKMVLDKEAQRRDQEYKGMVERSKNLGDGIRQTLAPSAGRRSDVASLMKGTVR